MVDIEILKEREITADRMKEIFTNEDTASDDYKTKERIRTRIRDRVIRGIQDNLTNYRYWWACDLAWDVPFRQTTPTLVRGFIDRGMKTEDVLKIMDGADISQMITYYDKDGNKLVSPENPNKVALTKVHAPTFFHIFIPLCKAYTTIRAAAIVNSYRQIPLFKYEAARSTKTNRLKAEVITDRVEVMSTQYGYFDVLKQAVMHMLHYSQAILFPDKEWDFEKQLRRKEDGGKGTEEVVIKEGLRFNIPHPSRTFIDQAYRPSTINSDTGVKFGGYWHITRYGEVAENKLYWNTDKVTTPGRDWRMDNPGFFNTVYNSCALKFSSPTDHDQKNREARLTFYTANNSDKAVTITEYFEKINPKEEGIGDYDYPVWFRYTVASDDTVLYATPLPYTPMAYFGYDALETRSVNGSMTLEILPFQDHISNLFTQYILTLKQNLANVTFFDTNQVSKEVVDWVKNLGEERYTGHNFAPMDMRQNRISQNNLQEAFQTFKFANNSPVDLITGVNEVLRVLERVLVLSPQELAQSASHELTAEEVRNISQARSTRYEFTAGAVDRGVYALKSMLYNGLMNYGEEDVYARLPLPVDEKILEALGFTVEETDSRHYQVKGKLSAVELESFASTRDGDLRSDNIAASQPMVQMLQIVLSNQALFMEIGVEQVLNFMNQIAAISGLPRDFQFAATGLTQQQQMQTLQKELIGIATQIKEATQQETVKQIDGELKPVVKDIDTRLDQMEAVINKLIQINTHSPIQPYDQAQVANAGGSGNPDQGVVPVPAGPVVSQPPTQ